MRKAYDKGKIRWAVLSVFAVAFMLVAVSFKSFAAEGTITAPSAKIRESASTSSAHIGSALNGEKYTITGQESDTSGYTWYKVTFGENKSGYIRGDLISVEGEVLAQQAAVYAPSVAVTELSPVTAKVTVASVRVRPDAAASGGVVTSVVKDTVVTIDGMATGSDNKVWYRVNCTVNGSAVLGFVREDFVALEGEALPPTQEEAPTDPVVPETPEEVVATSKPKAYDTVYENDRWYLFNNETNQKYVIEDIFSAVNTNRDLAVKYEKIASNQKGFIWVLSILFVIAIGVVTFLVWKLKDMLDEEYFKQVEKKALNDREASPKKVTHTVGEERKQVKKPAQGQQRGNDQRTQGEGVRKPAAQTHSGEEAARKPIKSPEGEKKDKSRQQMQAKPQQKKASPASEQSSLSKAKSQGFKSKNFIADDDEFEFEFLDWDGEEDL